MRRLKGDPLGEPRNPLAIYLLLLAALSGLLSLLGVTTAKSVEDSMPELVVTVWSLMLFLGSTLTLLGMFWQGDVRTGLVLKRTGMFSAGIAGVLYGVIVVLALGTGAMLAGGTVIGFGVACLVQFRHINKRIHAIISVTRNGDSL